ncbi:MAG: nitroreductase family protein [Candidatus Cyclonatronum sp.]|uniref:nitroreductase family protein n=1 Tax=Cyclonatronum sp. TaxID=3024185 RepID=UPI0025B9D026|nr:nitroreductase family protein [Cyclonatronum sp.]MCC5933562.1 nitroreductase family protein [Balneolales bacterium]MCH8486174.1 nitroreductase family protein [Cyclonatronum sp.]
MALYDIKIHVQNNWLLPIVHKHPKLADLYYFLFSSDFSREHQKVLKGKYMHLQALKEKKPNAFHLRRQVHRIEKGLIMKNRRNVFARDYIGDTVKNYEVLSNHVTAGGDIDTELLKWASNVLQAYFDAVDTEHAEIKPAYEQFLSIQHKIDFDPKKVDYVPYKRAQGVKSGVTYEQFLKLTQQRRSVRYFEQKEVPYELIEKAVRAATYSPSACNRQPFEFRIFTDEQMKNMVGSIPMGIRPFYENIPVMILLVGKLSAYLSERDRHVIYLDGGLFSMSFVLALETLGLSSVTINWPDIEYLEQKMENLIGVADDERVLMCIGVGYADSEGGIPFSQKKTPDQLLKRNIIRDASAGA